MLTADASKALAQAGLLVPASDEAHVAGTDAFEEVERVRRAWDAGDREAWPVTAIPVGPISMSQCWALANAVSFAIRRASDGYRASRPVAIDCLRLFRRLVFACNAAAKARALDPNPDPELTQAVVELTHLTLRVAQPLLLHLCTHLAPDVGRPDEDAWLSAEATSELRRTILVAMTEAHHALDDVLASPTSAEFAAVRLKERAQMAAGRVMAVTNGASADTGSSVPPVGFAGAPDGTELEQMRNLLRSYVDDADPSDPPAFGGAYIALAIVDYVWAGDLASFADAMRQLLKLESLPVQDRVSCILNCLELTASSDASIDILHGLLQLIAEQPVTVQKQLRARTTPDVCRFIARIALDDPASASRLAGYISGFDSDRRRWNAAHRHVWLLPGAPSVAIIDGEDGVVALQLPGLLQSPALLELVDRHAEEHERAWPVKDVRKKLSRDLKPLAEVLVELRASATFYAFGHLRHIPLPALTSVGGVLAERPELRRLAHRRSPYRTRAEVAGRGRVLVLDRSLKEAKQLERIPGKVHLYDSSRSVVADVPAAFDQLRSGAEQIVFFGHGYVDQFDVEKTGLVTRQTPDGAFFTPPVEFAHADLHSTELAVILACGAGQGNVFVEPCMSVADAFTLAGATFVISPVWPILANDAAAFLNLFLKEIDGGGDVAPAWSRVVAKDPNRFCSIMLFAD